MGLPVQILKPRRHHLIRKNYFLRQPRELLVRLPLAEQVTERLLKEKLSAKKSMLTDDHRQPGHCLTV